MRALLVAVVLLAGPVGPAWADDVPVTGSWTQLRVATALGDSPDLQAQDGPALPVENGPLGVIAFAAVRWTRSADLTLARVDSGSTTITPTVWACPAAGWPAGDRQPWSRRPAVDCTRHVVGTTTGDRMSWRTSAFGTAVDVVLVPAPSDGSVFAISFGAPTVDSFRTLPPPADGVAPPPQPSETPPPSTVAPVAPSLAGIAAPDLPARSETAAPSPAAQVAPPARANLAATGSDGPPPAWPGRLLLAFLSLLLVARAAFPSRLEAVPSSLVPGRSETGRP